MRALKKPTVSSSLRPNYRGSRRGLILIDPPYEMKTDYQAVVSGIAEGYKRFATGTYALWYPVVLRQQIKRMIHDLEAVTFRNSAN